MKGSQVVLLFSALVFWNCGGLLSVDTSDESYPLADEESDTSVTMWTEDLELFMEHPLLRVERQARFAVHLTKLSDFQPVAQGPVVFQFVKNGVPPKTVTVGDPEVPGIFGPRVTFEEAGEYTLHLEIRSDEIETNLEYGPIEVFDETEESPAPEESESGQTIAYLKEQQWKLPFASTVAGEREIRETLRIPAQIRAKAGTDSVVTAAIAGRYAPPGNGMPGLGTRVRKGDLLGYLDLLPADRSSILGSQIGTGITVSRLIQDAAQAEAMVSAEQARLELAEKEARRVGALVEAEALPKKRLDEVHSDLEVRKAALRAATEALVNYRNALSRFDRTEGLLGSLEEQLALHAPVSGQLVESRAVPGQYVDPGKTLFRIVDLSSVWVEGQVFENDSPRIQSLQGGTLQLPGLESLVLEPASLILIGPMVDPTTRTLPVVFEVRNREGRIKLGALGQLDLQTGNSVKTLAVPKPAVLLEENRQIVYVQRGGETFERRPVVTGMQDLQWVQILDGLEEGDRVVAVGAYNVALAARSTEVPEHGHVH